MKKTTCRCTSCVQMSKAGLKCNPHVDIKRRWYKSRLICVSVWLSQLLEIEAENELLTYPLLKWIWRLYNLCIFLFRVLLLMCLNLQTHCSRPPNPTHYYFNSLNFLIYVCTRPCRFQLPMLIRINWLNLRGQWDHHKNRDTNNSAVLEHIVNLM